MTLGDAFQGIALAGIKMTSEIRISPMDTYLEIVATGEVVDVKMMRSLLDLVIAAARTYSRVNVLLEVIAPKREIGIPELIDIWKYASDKGLRRIRLAHVITGRPLREGDVSFKEAFAHNRGLKLKTFAIRDHALEWLKVESD
jgi:hypothetical protein